MGCRRQSNTTVLQAAAAAAHAVGKPLYIGEYGGLRPNFTGPTAAAQAFPTAVLEWQVEASRGESRGHQAARTVGADPGTTLLPHRLRTLSSIWAWTCPSHSHSMYCLDPNPGAGGLPMADEGAEAVADRGGNREGSGRMIALMQWAERRLRHHSAHTSRT